MIIELLAHVCPRWESGGVLVLRDPPTALRPSPLVRLGQVPSDPYVRYICICKAFPLDIECQNSPCQDRVHTSGMIAHRFDYQIDHVYIVHVSQHATPLVTKRSALVPAFLCRINDVDAAIVREFYRLVQPAPGLVFRI